MAVSVGGGPTWSGAVSAVQSVNGVFVSSIPFEVNQPPHTASDYSTATTRSLLLTGFGFSVPSNETVTNVAVNVTRAMSDPIDSSLSPSPGVLDETIRLLKAGVASGANVADVSTVWPTVQAQRAYSGTDPYWGTTVTWADANDPGFGVTITVKGVRASTRLDYTWAGVIPFVDFGDPIAQIDRVQIVLTTVQNTGAKPMKDNGVNPRVLEGFCLG